MIERIAPSLTEYVFTPHRPRKANTEARRQRHAKNRAINRRRQRTIKWGSR